MTAASPLRRVLAVVLALAVALVGSMSLSAPAADAATTPATSSTIGTQTPEALSVTVAGSGFSGEAPGLYVSLAPEGTSSTTDASQYLGTQWIQASQIVGGEFTTTLSLAAAQIATLDPTKQYVVHTMKAHGQAATDPSQTTATPIALDFVALGLTPAPQDPETPEEPENPGTPEDPETPGTPEEPSAPAVPQVSVSDTSVSASGQTTVTVSGTGFDPQSSIAANRPPLAGKPGGVYVAFGKFAESWKPSAGAARGNRPAVGSETKWAVLAEDMATVGGPSAGAIELRPDGSFTAQIVLDKAAADTAAAALTSGNYGIYTYPGGGAVTPSFETYTPITFEPPVVVPVVPTTSSTITAQSVDGLTVDVVGSGFSGAAPGLYVSLAVEGTTSTTDASQYVGTKFVMPMFITNGSFSTTISLTKEQVAALDSTKQYVVHTMKAHGQAATDPSQTTATPISLDFSLLQPAAPVVPSTSSTITAQSVDGLTVDVVGSGFSGAAPGLYVSLAVEGTTSTTDASQYVGTKFVMPMFITNGTFSTTISLTKEQVEALDSTKQYVVHTMKAHGQAATDPSQTTATPIALDFTLLQPAPEPPGPTVSPLVTAQSADGLTVDVVGSGFSGAAPGLYVSLAVEGTTSATDASQYLGTKWIQASQITGGAFTTSISLTKEQVAALDSTKQYVVHTMKAHGQAATDPSQTTATPISLDFTLLQPGGPTDPGTDPPVTPPTSIPRIGSGYLAWGVKSSFRSYITTVAAGTVKVSGGASESGGAYVFPQTSNAGSTTGYGGSVNFNGHGGVLDLTISSPAVRIDSSSRAVLTAQMGAGRVEVAVLDLTAASVQTVDGATVYRGAPATLTASGATAFSGFYAAGTAMDPVTFAIGSNVAAGSFAPARTVATSAAAKAFVPPASPPATTGISVPADVDLENVTPGQEITFTAEGFQPNETGIKVVVYSTPIVLAEDVKADAAGAVTWTGSIPTSLEPGRHTLTFQGSVDRGIEFTVVAAAVIGGCEVTDAVATWGLKESFRSYVSGSIANGDWTTSGNISYTTPEFGFAGGTGAFDTESAAGQVDFTGSIDFTGHGGALAVTFADPSIRFVDGDTALLVVDVTAADRAAAEAGDTAATTTQDVAFAELDLAAVPLEESDGDWSATDVPTTLTAEGHAVFSSYETGAELDPIDVAFSTGTDCAPKDDVAAAGDATSSSVGGDDSGTTWWPWAVGGALLVALAAGGGIAIARRHSA